MYKTIRLSIIKPITGMPCNYFGSISDYIKRDVLWFTSGSRCAAFPFLLCRIGLQIQMGDQKEKNRFEGLWLKLEK